MEVEDILFLLNGKLLVPDTGDIVGILVIAIIIHINIITMQIVDVNQVIIIILLIKDVTLVFSHVLNVLHLLYVQNRLIVIIQSRDCIPIQEHVNNVNIPVLLAILTQQIVIHVGMEVIL